MTYNRPNPTYFSLLTVVVSLLGITGCSVKGGYPIWNWHSLNTNAISEWHEDDDFMVTYHQQMENLDQLRNDAPNMSAQWHQEKADLLAKMYSGHKAPVMRREILRAAIAIPSSDVLPLLQDAVEDDDSNIRRMAYKEWGKRPGQVAMPVLLNGARSESDKNVRIEIIRALGRFKNQQVYDIVSESLKDRDPAVQLAATDAMKELTGLDYGDSPEPWIAHIEDRPVEIPEEKSLSWWQMINPLYHMGLW